ncbi:MAG: dienelactone hydrolase family protein [Acidimicrobiia bacterium]|nr:dienelactone hydrolase family protein [Acidimicrobiia bacterium]
MALAGEVTDASRVRTETVQLGEIDVYVAHPTADGPHPAIVVLEEAFGRVEHIEDLCRRFANAGFVAASPELYARTGAPGHDFDVVLPAMFGLPDSQIVGDVEAVADYARGLDDTTDAVAVTGFCMGGRATTLTAFSSERFDAAIPCWGGFINKATFEDDTTESRPVPPAQLAGNLSCPIFLVGGADDENPSPSELQALQDELASADKDVTLKIYDGAGHAFLADYRDSYNEEKAHELWDDMLAFLADKL